MGRQTLKYGWIAQVGDLREIVLQYQYIDNFAFRSLWITTINTENY